MDDFGDLRGCECYDSEVETSRQILDLRHVAHRLARVKKVRELQTDPGVTLDVELGSRGPLLDLHSLALLVLHVEVVLVVRTHGDSAP